MLKTTRKQDCWEFMECGRGPGSAREAGVDTCPASRDSRLHGTHGGRNAGRACWVVAGTRCGDVVAGTFANKFSDCQQCPFYATVKREEHSAFRLSATLLSDLGPEA
jgi:hypothetical protein